MIHHYRSIALVLGSSVLFAWGGFAAAEDPQSGIGNVANPQVVRGSDPKLEKEFDYLVYHLGKEVELKLVKVSAKGQSFAIGSSAKERDDVTKKFFDGKRPADLDFEAEQEVTLTDDFYIGPHEVTRGQFRRFVEETKYTTETEASDGGYGWNEELKKFEGRDREYSWKNYGVSSETDDYPVTNITRNDARKFCEWLAEKGDGNVGLREVRLPGEAEWEFACRAGSRSRFSFGDEDGRLTEFANVADGTWAETFSKSSAIQTKDGHAFSAPVGQFKPRTKASVGQSCGAGPGTPARKRAEARNGGWSGSVGATVAAGSELCVHSKMRTPK